MDTEKKIYKGKNRNYSADVQKQSLDNYRKNNYPAWQILGVSPELRQDIINFQKKHNCPNIAAAIETALKLANKK